MKELVVAIVTIMVIGLLVFFFSKSWKKALAVVGGWFLYKSFNFLYDFILWPYVQLKYGLAGFFALTLGAMIINFSILFWYNANGKDYLGFEYLSKTWFLKNKIVAFIVLSIYEDSFVTIAFFKQGKAGKLSKKDIVIFIASTILGCISFSIFWVAIFFIFKFVSGWF